MLSEEEEEEDEESEMEHKSRAMQDHPRVGDHLQNEPQLMNQSPANQKDQAPHRTQVFSGSSDEWTDQRIREFQEQMEKSRLGITQPEQKGADSAATKGNAA